MGELCLAFAPIYSFWGTGVLISLLKILNVCTDIKNFATSISWSRRLQNIHCQLSTLLTSFCSKSAVLNISVYFNDNDIKPNIFKLSGIKFFLSLLLSIAKDCTFTTFSKREITAKKFQTGTKTLVIYFDNWLCFSTGSICQSENL